MGEYPDVVIEWSIIKDGKVTKLDHGLTFSMIEDYRNKGYTVSKSVETSTAYWTNTKITSYSPLTREEYSKKMMAQQRALYSRKSTGKRNTRRQRKSTRMGEVY